MSTTTLERRKQFQPTATRATQPIKEKDFQSAAELIKQRGAASIDLATEVVTSVTIEFIVPPGKSIPYLQRICATLPETN
eukprot:12425041-Ditylum_brightwellii.AAC.1